MTAEAEPRTPRSSIHNQAQQSHLSHPVANGLILASTQSFLLVHLHPRSFDRRLATPINDATLEWSRGGRVASIDSRSLAFALLATSGLTAGTSTLATVGLSSSQQEWLNIQRGYIHDRSS